MSKLSYLELVRRTAAFNLVSTGVSGATGVALARWLGPTGRGEYAGATAIFGLFLIFFELGIPASVVYFIARGNERPGDYLRSATWILLAMSALASGACWIVAVSVLDQGSNLRRAVLILPYAVFVSFLGAPASFALQAMAIKLWNLVRIVQPTLFAVELTFLYFTDRIDVVNVIRALVLSLAAQTVLAWLLCASRLDVRGSCGVQTAGPLVKYGLFNAASTAPNAINGRLDQIVLLILTSSAGLGQYAVAVSLSVMTVPIAAAFGNVAFPRIAGASEVARTIRQAIVGTYTVTVFGVVTILGLTPVVVMPLLGVGYEDVPRLLLLLAPGAVFYAGNQVVGDLLRGLGRPGLVAFAEWLGVAGTFLGMVVLVPRMGAFGAALTSSAAYTLVHVLLRLSMLTAAKTRSGSRNRPHAATARDA